MTVPRRRFLRRAGVVGVATFAGIAGLPDPPSALRDGPSVDRGYPAAKVTDEAAAPHALWQYRPLDGGTEFEPTAPINVVFELAESELDLTDVMAVLHGAGWYETVEEYARYAYNVREQRYELQHATAAQSYYGGFGRHHVRCWEFDGVVSMQAHQDTWANPRHGIVSYEQTRERIGTRYASEGWSVSADGLWFDNASAPDHDGYVTVIEP